MREILFRGKTDKGKWEYGSLNVLPNGDYQIASRCTNPPDSDPLWKRILITHKINPETVGQYTGLVDMNGKKIFEGDICEYGYDYEYEGEVFFDVYEFAVTGREDVNSIHDLVGYNAKEEKWYFVGKVIGNIHDKEEE